MTTELKPIPFGTWDHKFGMAYTTSAGRIFYVDNFSHSLGFTGFYLGSDGNYEERDQFPRSRKLYRAPEYDLVPANTRTPLSSGGDVPEAFMQLGKPSDNLSAFHDMPSDAILFSNSGVHITVGDVRELQRVKSSRPEQPSDLVKNAVEIDQLRSRAQARPEQPEGGDALEDYTLDKISFDEYQNNPKARLLISLNRLKRLVNLEKAAPKSILNNEIDLLEKRIHELSRPRGEVPGIETLIARMYMEIGVRSDIHPDTAEKFFAIIRRAATPQPAASNWLEEQAKSVQKEYAEMPEAQRSVIEANSKSRAAASEVLTDLDETDLQDWSIPVGPPNESPAPDAVKELVEALKGVVRVADRKTVEFDAARELISKHSKEHSR